MARFFPYSATSENRAMVFVDGENLAIFRRCFFSSSAFRNSAARPRLLNAVSKHNPAASLRLTPSFSGQSIQLFTNRFPHVRPDDNFFSTCHQRF